MKEGGFKLAVIGDQEFGLGFRLAGIRDIYEISDTKEAENTVEKILDDRSIGIVVIQQNIFDNLSVSLKREIEERTEPTFVKVGGEMGIEELKEKIRRAIGVDLWK